MDLDKTYNERTSRLEKRVAELEEDSHPPLPIDSEGFNRRITDLEKNSERISAIEESIAQLDRRCIEDAQQKVRDWKQANNRVTRLEEKLTGAYQYTPPTADSNLKKLKEAMRTARDAAMLEVVRVHSSARNHAAPLLDLWCLVEKYNEANDRYQDARKCR